MRTLAAIILSLLLCCDEKSAQAPPVKQLPAAAQSSAPITTKPAVVKKVLVSTLAGSWYTADASALRQEVRSMMDSAPSLDGRPFALISPHAGYRFSGPTAAHGYKAVEGRKYGRIFIMGPSHRVPMRGISIPDATHISTPLGEVEVDLDTVAALKADPIFGTVEAAHRGEHSVDIQLPFVQTAQPGMKIVPMVVGHLDAAMVRQAAKTLRAVVGPEDLVIASSDFTHYGPNYDYMPFSDDVPAKLRELDSGAYGHIQSLDLDGFMAYKEKTGDTICGFYPVSILLAMLPAGSKANLLKYDTSGNVTSDYTNSVSYYSVAFTGQGWAAAGAAAPTPGPPVEALADAEKETSLRLARDSLDLYVKEHRVLDAASGGYDLTPRLKMDSGVFVTLKKGGELRGCIGQILPVGPLWKGIVDHAIDAAVNDHRFPPVQPDELASIEIEVSVLTAPKPVPSYNDIVVGRHGMTLSKNGRSAVFLPQVAPEQGWNLEQTLSHLSRKAGLEQDAWREGASFTVFEAIVFGETERSHAGK